MNALKLKPVVLSEHQEQCTFFSWVRPYLRTKGIDPRLCYAVPNSQMLMAKLHGDEKFKVMNYLRAEGFTDGALDINFDYPSADFHGLRIELKRIGGKPSDEQAKMLAALRNHRYNAVVCQGCDEAVRALKFYVEHARAA